MQRLVPYLKCTGDEVRKQTELNKMWAKKHKQKESNTLGGWRNPTLGQSQQVNKDKLLRVFLRTLLGFLIKIVYEYSLIWIMSDISLLTKWKVVLWNIWNTLPNFFNFPKIHNFLRNWI